MCITKIIRCSEVRRLLEMNQIYNMDCIEGMKQLESDSINCCVTSPPYWGLRDYGVEGQIGLESTPEEYVQKMVEVFREVKRVLREDGTLWLNLGDSYCGSGKGIGSYPDPKWDKARNDETKHKTDWGKCGLKSKDIIGIPWMVAFALRTDGWYLRQDIIWAKPNPMPESVRDRCTKAHEYIFLLSKSPKYYFDSDAIAENTIYPVGSRADKKRGDFKGKYHAHEDFKHISDSFRAIRDKRNKRDVWTVATKPFRDAHFATFPPKLIEPCILAGCPKGGIVIDPFMGSGTTAMKCIELQRNYVGFELNPEYIKIAKNQRVSNVQLKII
jgi:DNA modification methylase